mmetsp:Transcript_16647/g.36401  ORF Transcript_16647/g.36401 Transcript_16647/m.36401 type:complete len:121 (-) Transcript_16647:232-594(-)
MLGINWMVFFTCTDALEDCEIRQSACPKNLDTSDTDFCHLQTHLIRDPRFVGSMNESNDSLVVCAVDFWIRQRQCRPSGLSARPGDGRGRARFLHHRYHHLELTDLYVEQSGFTLGEGSK